MSNIIKIDLTFKVDSDSKFKGFVKTKTYFSHSCKDLANQSFSEFKQCLNLITSSKGLESVVFMEKNPSPHFHVYGKIEDWGKFDTECLLNEFFQKRIEQIQPLMTAFKNGRVTISLE